MSAPAERETRATRRRSVARVVAALVPDPRRLLLFAAPGLILVAIDLALRHAQLLHVHRMRALGYFASALLGAVLWGSLLREAVDRRGLWRAAAGAVFALSAGWVFGAELAFRHAWGTYLSQDGMLD